MGHDTFVVLSTLFGLPCRVGWLYRRAVFSLRPVWMWGTGPKMADVSARKRESFRSQDVCLLERRAPNWRTCLVWLYDQGWLRKFTDFIP